MKYQQRITNDLKKRKAKSILYSSLFNLHFSFFIFHFSFFIVPFSLFILLPHSASAQADSCETLVLKEMAVKLRSQGIRGGGIVKTNMMGARSVAVSRDAQGIITGIATPLFSEAMKQQAPSPFYAFAERYLLHLALLSPTERSEHFRDDQTALTPAAITFVDSLCHINISSDENHVSMTWTSPSGQMAQLSFPKSYELITGQNKIERDRLLHGQLLHIGTPAPRPPLIVSDDDLIKPDSVDYYIRKGQFYLIREMTSDTYYLQDQRGEYIPIADQHYPGETLSNIFTNTLTSQLRLNLDHRVYGMKGEPLSIELAAFDDYCRRTGCKPYVGVEQVTPDGIIKGTVLYVNTDLGYNHLLYVQADSQVLAKRKGTINAQLFSYVPTHNLKDLFYDKTKQKQRAMDKFRKK